VDNMATAGALLGCDYAGVVEEVGRSVDKHLKKGDSICGFAHGANSVQLEDGTFAEYIVVKGDLAMKIPENVSFEKAATLGVAMVTIGQGLYQQMKLERPLQPTKAGRPILIYGGSGGMGTFGIQFAKLSACPNPS
jgi:NADPH:quinone reductase-like Zn-dependent oxidoreductase